LEKEHSYLNYSSNKTFINEKPNEFLLRFDKDLERFRDSVKRCQMCIEMEERHVEHIL